jgi:hypothetical protein
MVRTSPPLGSVMSQMNPLHSLTTSAFRSILILYYYQRMGFVLLYQEASRVIWKGQLQKLYLNKQRKETSARQTQNHHNINVSGWFVLRAVEHNGANRWTVLCRMQSIYQSNEWPTACRYVTN